MKRGKPLQGLGSGKTRNKTVLDIRYASNGRGLNKKPRINRNS